MNSQLGLVCCTILLPILQCHSHQVCNTKFTKVSKCPTNHSELQRHTAAGEYECVFACNKNPHCGIFHFNETQQVCYQGNSSCSGLTLWSDGPCASYREETRTTEVSSTTRELVEQLSLKLLYRFTTHGLVNLADPGQFTLREHNTCFSSDGVRFDGSQDSYLTTETPGLDDLIDYGKSFSAFVQVKRELVSKTVYAMLLQCDDEVDRPVVWAFGNNGRLTVALLHWRQLLTYHSAEVSSSSSSHPQQVESVGCVFDGTRVSGFYYNGTVLGVGQLVNTTSSSSSSGGSAAGKTCLQLGRGSVSSGLLLDAMRCFGVSDRALAASELRLLQDWCLC